MIRINKYLADCGIGSRRKVEELILQGRISVNNKVVSELGFQVDENKDVVFLDGEKIKLKKSLYFLLNKPKGYITSVKDDRSRKTVIDLINVKERIYPVGRLDYDSTGLLFLTNDGDFSQLLTHPGNKVPREYEVKLDKPLEEENKKNLLNGIYLDSKKGKFLEVKFLDIKDKRTVKVVCEEGRNRFVKRMFGSLDYKVKSLNRVSYAGIKLDIPLGSYRQFTAEEIKIIKEKYSLSRRNSGKRPDRY